MKGPDRRRIEVIAPYGRLIHEIRPSRSEGGWEARVVTLPNQIWVEPGGRRALVFAAGSADGALEMAARFVTRDCLARGHRLAEAVASPADAEEAPEPSRRRLVSVPVRFLTRGSPAGAPRAPLTAITQNVSETGLFIVTPHLLAPGARLALEITGFPERLEGVVVWTRRQGGPGRERGMGIRLTDPPLSYRAGVQTMGR